MLVHAWKWEPTTHVLVQMGILDETVRLTLIGVHPTLARMEQPAQ